MADKSAALPLVSEPTKDTRSAQASTSAPTETVGAQPIDKKQPWRDIIQQDKFAQPDFFKEKPAPSSDNKIRLLNEIDTKSR